MRIYDNEIRIHPDLNPTAPQEPQSYHLNKLFEIEAYFHNEIEVREQIAKKMNMHLEHENVSALFNIYLRMMIFTLFTYRINKAVALQCMLYGKS